MRYLLFISLVCQLNVFWAQVPQKVAAELFTNTLCSTCGNLEPNITNVLNSSSEVIKVSYYPSSPYPNCFFSKQNKIENDDRTKYYNAYGSTPKVFIQGAIQSNQLSVVTLSNFLGKTTDFELQISNVAQSATSAEVTFTIFRRGNDTTQSATLFLAIQEDSVNYAAPNGIGRHYGVFRKALTALEGEVVALPVGIGDSLVITKTYSISSDWNKSLLSAYAILQQTNNKKVIQVEKQKLDLGVTLLVDATNLDFVLFPNPAQSVLTIAGADFKSYQIIDWNGRVLDQKMFTGPTINISSLSYGSYLLLLESKDGQIHTKSFAKTK